jgi:hypothetical protein
VTRETKERNMRRERRRREGRREDRKALSPSLDHHIKKEGSFIQLSK